MSTPSHRQRRRSIQEAIQLNGPTPTLLVNIYRPPKPNKDFIDEFTTFLTHICALSPNIIFLGDFNIHMDNTKHTLTKDFHSCLDSFGLKQHIDFPTHCKGHILVLVCCSGVTPSNCSAVDLGCSVSDHMLVSFSRNLTFSIVNQLRVMSFRNINDNNFADFTADIDSLSIIIPSLAPRINWFPSTMTVYNLC